MFDQSVIEVKTLIFSQSRAAIANVPTSRRRIKRDGILCVQEKNGGELSFQTKVNELWEEIIVSFGLFYYDYGGKASIYFSLYPFKNVTLIFVSMGTKNFYDVLNSLKAN